MLPNSFSLPARTAHGDLQSTSSPPSTSQPDPQALSAAPLARQATFAKENAGRAIAAGKQAMENGPLKEMTAKFAKNQNLDFLDLQLFLATLCQPYNADSYRFVPAPQPTVNLQAYKGKQIDIDAVLQRLLKQSAIPENSARHRFISKRRYVPLLDKNDGANFIGENEFDKLICALAYLEDKPETKTKERIEFIHHLTFGARDFEQCGSDERLTMRDAPKLLELGALHSGSLRFTLQDSAVAYFLKSKLASYNDFFDSIGIEEEGRQLNEKLRTDFLNTGIAEHQGKTLSFDAGRHVRYVQAALQKDWSKQSGAIAKAVAESTDILRPGSLNFFEFSSVYLNLQEINLFLQTDISIMDLLCHARVLARTDKQKARFSKNALGKRAMNIAVTGALRKAKYLIKLCDKKGADSSYEPRFNSALTTLLGVMAAPQYKDAHALLVATALEHCKDVKSIDELQSLTSSLPTQLAVRILLDMAGQKNSFACALIKTSGFLHDILPHASMSDWRRWLDQATPDSKLLSLQAILALKASNNAMADDIIENHVLDFSVRDEKDYSLLQQIVLHGQVSLFRHLKKYSDFNKLIAEKTTKGETILHLAVVTDNAELVLDVAQELKRHKLDIDAQAEVGSTALSKAAADGCLQSVVALIQAEANIHVEHQWGTALIDAARCGYPEIVQKLLDAGADVTTRSRHGESALLAAVQNEYIEVVKKLIRAEAHLLPQDHMEEALILAASGGNLKSVEALIEAKTNINVKDDMGNTPLIVAAEDGHLSVVRSLLALKVDMSTENIFGNTALHSAKNNGHIEVVEALQVAEDAKTDTTNYLSQ